MEDIKYILCGLIDKLNILEIHIKEQEGEINELKKVTHKLYEERLKIINPKLYENIKRKNTKGSK